MIFILLPLWVVLNFAVFANDELSTGVKGGYLALSFITLLLLLSFT